MTHLLHSIIMMSHKSWLKYSHLQLNNKHFGRTWKFVKFFLEKKCLIFFFHSTEIVDAIIL